MKEIVRKVMATLLVISMVLGAIPKFTVAPKVVEAASVIPKVAQGNQTLILINGDLYATGKNTYGAFGNGTTNDSLVMVKIDTSSQIDGKIIDIQAGYEHSVVLTDRNKVYTTGRNTEGQLGINSIANNKVNFVQVQVPSGMENKKVRSIGTSIGGHSTYVIYEDGEIYACGANNDGLMGLGDSVNRKVLTRLSVPTDHKNFIMGPNSSVYIDSAGDIYAAGDKSITGLDSSGTSTIFTKLPTQPPSPVKEILLERFAIHVLGEDGEIYSIGKKHLGVNNNSSYSAWIKADKPSNINSWLGIQGNDYGVFSYGDDGFVYAWGASWYGSLGTGVTTVDNNVASNFIAAPVYYSNGTNFNSKGEPFEVPLQMSSSSANTIAVSTDGRLYVCGSGSSTGLNTGVHAVVYLNELKFQSFTLSKTSDTPVLKESSDDFPVTISAYGKSSYSGANAGIGSDLQWFRVSGRDDVQYSTMTSFNNKFAAASDDNKGYMMPSAGGTKTEQGWTLPVNQNGKYWVKANYKNDAGTTFYHYRSIVVDDIYVKPDLFVKGLDSSNSAELYPSQIDTSLPEIYGVAYDLDSTTNILASTGNGTDIVYNENISSPTYANVAVIPRSQAPAYNTITPESYNFVLNPAAMTGTVLGSNIAKPIIFLYNRDSSYWKTITYEGVDESGVTLTGFEADPYEERISINTEYTRTPPEVTGYTAIGFKINDFSGTLNPLNSEGNVVVTPTTGDDATIIYVYRSNISGISGKVTVADSYSTELPFGIPVAGVKVTFTDIDDSSNVKTDVTTINGGYNISELTPGKYLVTTDPNPLNGFKSYTDEITITGVSEYNIELNPLTDRGVSYITVVNEEGVRQPNAKVVVNGVTYMTGTNGKVLVINLPAPGTHTAMVSKDKFIPATKNIVLSGGETYKNVEVIIRRGEGLGALYGYVKYESNNLPASGVTVKTLTGLTATTDSNGYYIILDVPAGTHTISATKAGYETAFDMVGIPSSEFAQKDFVLKRITLGSENYIITGKVTDKKTGLPINGAIVSGGSKSIITDDFGNYLIGYFLAGTNVVVNASSSSHTREEKSITAIGKDEVLDFQLLQTVKTTVIGFTNVGKYKELYRYVLTNDYSDSGKINVRSNLIPTYKVNDPTNGSDFPAYREEEVALDKNRTVKFEYLDNMGTVTIKAFIKDTTEAIADFEKFSIKTEVGYPFSFTDVPIIKGYTYDSTSGDIESVSEDGRDSIIFYYTRNVSSTGGKFNVTAIDNDTDNVIGQIENNTLISAGQTFDATDINAPTESNIPNLAYYELVSGSGFPTSVTYNGYDSPDDVTYKYQRIMRSYVVERWNSITGTKIDTFDDLTATVKVGETYTVSQPSSPAGYEPAPGHDNQYKFILQPGTGDYIVKFYYKPATTANISIKAVWDNGGVETEIPGYSSTLSGIPGTTATIDPPTIAGYTLKVTTPEQSSVEKEFGKDTEIKFVYKKEMVNVTVEHRLNSETGNLIAGVASDVKSVQKDVLSYIIAKPISGYVLQTPYVYTETFTEDTTRIFVYKKIQDVVNENSVSIVIKGKAGAEELYSYTITRPQGSGDITATAFSLDKYELKVPTSSPVTIPTDGSKLEHVFEYSSLATTLKVSAVLDDDSSLVAGFTPISRPVIKGSPYVAYAPYITGYNLVGQASQTVYPVTGTEADNVVFRYEKAVGNVVVNLVDIEDNNKIIKTISAEVTVGEVNKEIPIPPLANENYITVSTTPTKVNYDTETQTVTYQYKKAKRFVEVYTLYNGDETKVSETEYRVDSVQTIPAPTPPADSKLNDADSKNLLVVAGDGNQKVVFNYTTILEEEVVVNAMLDGTPKTLIQTYTVKATKGSFVTAEAPTILGYKLKDPTENKKLAEAPGVIEFLYIKDEVKVTIGYKSDGKVLAGNTVYQLAKGGDITVYAPHIEGYVLIGADSKTFEKVTEPITDFFTYVPIDSLNVNIVIEGISGTEILYSYTITKPRNSDDFQVKAFNLLDKYKLSDPSKETATISTDGNTTKHIFNYTLQETTVKISAVLDSDGTTKVPGTTDMRYPATIGTSYIGYAPYIPGYNLVGNITQKVDTVTGTATDDLNFRYEKATGNVVVNLIDSETGNIIKSESFQVTVADEDKPIPIPDLTDQNYTVKPGETEKTVSYSTDIQEINYDYVKAKRIVEVYTLYNEDEVKVSETEYRVDSIQKITAPLAPTGSKLNDAGSKTVVVVTGDGSQKVVFNYTTTLVGDVVVNAMLEGSPNTLIKTFTIGSTVGEKITATAPTIMGYELKTGESSIKEVTAPGDIEFIYVKNEVTVTVSYKSNGLIIPGTESTVYTVAKGGNKTVYAPHLAGYVLTGVSSKTYTGLETNVTFDFTYAPIKSLVVNIEIKGISNGEELYSYIIIKAKDSGTFEVEAFDLKDYKLVNPALKTATLDTTADGKHVFEYTSLEAEVKISAIFDEDDSELSSMIYPATIGSPYVGYAPYIKGYNLIGKAVKPIDSVTGVEEIIFRYELAKGNIVINLKDSETGNIIKTKSVEVTLLDGNKEIDIPDLTSENYIAVTKTPEVLSYSTEIQTINYEYVKVKRKVDVYTVFNGEKVLAYTTDNFNVDSVQEISAAPAPAGSKLNEASTKTVLVVKGKGNQEVEFNYTTILDGEVVVSAVLNGVNTIIQTYTVATTEGSKVTATAPTIKGYKLVATEQDTKEVAAPGAIRFLYEKDEVIVTISYEYYGEKIPGKADAVYAVTKGDDLVVYAPYIQGYILSGMDSKVFINLIADETFTFEYTQMEFNPVDFTNLIVKFVDVDEDKELGADGAKDLFVGDVYSYKYPSLSSIGYGFNSSAPTNDGEVIRIILSPANNEIIVYYKKRTASITINHYDFDTKDLIELEKVSNAAVGTLYTAKYYDLTNYYYYEGSNQVIVKDGTNEINIYYKNRNTLPAKSVVVEHAVQSPNVILKTEIINTTGSSIGLIVPYDYNTKTEKVVTEVKGLGYDIEIDSDKIHTIPIGKSITIYYKVTEQSVTVEYYDITNGSVIEVEEKSADINTFYVPYIKYFSSNYSFHSLDPEFGVMVKQGENKIRINYSSIEKEKIPATLTINYIANGKIFNVETVNGYFVGDSVFHRVATTLNVNERNYSLMEGEINPKTIVLEEGLNVLEFRYDDLGMTPVVPPAIPIPNNGNGGNTGGGSSESENKPVQKPEVEEPTVDVGTDKLELEAIKDVAYVGGYENGLFKAEKGLTRAEATTMFYKLLKNIDKTKSYNNQYSDVSEDSWYYNQVGALSELGVLSGYPDGTFRPDEEISRAEFVTIVIKAKDTTGTYKSLDTFSDVAHWATEYIIMARKKGWISGYDNNQFKPNNKITRAESVTILNNILERKMTKEEASKVRNPYSDLTNEHWAYSNILEASVSR